MAVLQASEKRVLALFQQKTGEICSRDEIAEALWGHEWPQKYSNWMIDTLIYRLRRKLAANLEIKTVRNLGYLFAKKGYEFKSQSLKSVFLPVPGIAATEEYLNYMNNPRNLRRGLINLFNAVAAAGLTPALSGQLLIINSFSYDNVDALKNWPGEVMMTHYDERVLALHRRRVEELNLSAKIQVVYDDIRQTRLAANIFNVVINDFRLNFNTDHWQNQQMVAGMKQVLKPKGKLFVSAVFSRRKGWFNGAEKLPRPCWPLEYYRRLFTAAGLKIQKEFDAQAGDSWFQSMPSLHLGFEPRFRRWLLLRD